MVIAVFGNTLRQETIREVKHIVDFLRQRDVDIVLSHELRHEAFNREFPSVEDYISQTGETIDFALSVGGDGTFLTTASLVGHLDIPILGINCGHLGYLAEVQTEEIDAVLDQLITNTKRPNNHFPICRLYFLSSLIYTPPFFLSFIKIIVFRIT